jgi:hypothetical protein
MLDAADSFRLLQWLPAVSRPNHTSYLRTARHEACCERTLPVAMKLPNLSSGQKIRFYFRVFALRTFRRRGPKERSFFASNKEGSGHRIPGKVEDQFPSQEQTISRSERIPGDLAGIK